MVVNFRLLAIGGSRAPLGDLSERDLGDLLVGEDAPRNFTRPESGDATRNRSVLDRGSVGEIAS